MAEKLIDWEAKLTSKPKNDDSSSSGSSTNSGNSSSKKSTSQQVKIVDLTAEAEAKELEPVENKNNDYTKYWDGQGTEERLITGNTPQVHIYISREKLGANSLTREKYDIRKLFASSDELKSDKDVNPENTAIYKDGNKEVLVHQNIDILDDN